MAEHRWKIEVPGNLHWLVKILSVLMPVIEFAVPLLTLPPIAAVTVTARLTPLS